MYCKTPIQKLNFHMRPTKSEITAMQTRWIYPHKRRGIFAGLSRGRFCGCFLGTIKLQTATLVRSHNRRSFEALGPQAWLLCWDAAL